MCMKGSTRFYSRFYQDGLSNKLGKLTMKLSEFLGSQGWALMLCNGGSVTPKPDSRPNQLFSG